LTTFMIHTHYIRPWYVVICGIAVGRRMKVYTDKIDYVYGM